LHPEKKMAPSGGQEGVGKRLSREAAQQRRRYPNHNKVARSMLSAVRFASAMRAKLSIGISWWRCLMPRPERAKPYISAKVTTRRRLVADGHKDGGDCSCPIQRFIVHCIVLPANLSSPTRWSRCCRLREMIAAAARVLCTQIRCGGAHGLGARDWGSAQSGRVLGVG
jgi:hypothetical protein